MEIYFQWVFSQDFLIAKGLKTLLRHRRICIIPFATHHSIRSNFSNHNSVQDEFTDTATLDDELLDTIHQRSRQFLIQILIEDIVIHGIFN